MKSEKEMNQYYQEKFEEYLSTQQIVYSYPKPKRFIEILKNHKGIIDFSKIDNDSHVDLRNPLIVVLGDSVTGGHFEIIDYENMIIAQDLQDGYVEKFKHMLHDAYSFVTINIINSGIAGDNVKGMYKRLNRDVISFQPDLVIINATLNWSKNRGNITDYCLYLEKIIVDVMTQTNAEIILMTPNGAIETQNDQNLDARVEIVRELAKKYHITLVDIYKMWKDVVANNDVRDTLSNDENHPTPLGHTYIAKALMQIFEEKEYEKNRNIVK